MKCHCLASYDISSPRWEKNTMSVRCGDTLHPASRVTDVLFFIYFYFLFFIIRFTHALTHPWNFSCTGFSHIIYVSIYSWASPS